MKTTQERDWVDVAWLGFVAELGELPKGETKRLKEAFLAGARAGLEEASRVVADHHAGLESVATSKEIEA